MPSWADGEDTRMAEYRGEDKWNLPLSDREPELVVCGECGEPLDARGECQGCYDAYLDAMESRIDREEYFHDDR